MDFLYNTKTGHCNRFAAGLAMMLRSIDIPCRVVSGFRGADSRGDGWYDVRHCHAHTWVEVYVPRREPPTPQDLALGNLGRESWRSLTLDPTPLDESIEAVADVPWWNSSSWDIEQLFKDLVLNYSPERRDAVVEQLQDAAAAGWTAFCRQVTAAGPAGARLRAGLLLAAGSFMAVAIALIRWRRARRRQQLPPARSVIAYQRRLLAILRGAAGDPFPRRPLASLSTGSPRCWKVSRPITSRSSGGRPTCITVIVLAIKRRWPTSYKRSKAGSMGWRKPWHRAIESHRHPRKKTPANPLQCGCVPMTSFQPERLSTADTAVLIVDVQEKLLPKIAGADGLLRNLVFLLDACKILGVPVSATEQYPKGLGATVPELAARLPAERPKSSRLAVVRCPRSWKDSGAAAGRKLWSPALKRTYV